MQTCRAFMSETQFAKGMVSLGVSAILAVWIGFLAIQQQPAVSTSRILTEETVLMDGPGCPVTYEGCLELLGQDFWLWLACNCGSFPP